MTESNQPASALNDTSADQTNVRPVMLSLQIKERSSLQAAYMPFLNNGGLFISGARGYQMGDDIYLQLTLPDDAQKYPIAGKVAWLTPAGAVNNRAPGIGIHFPADSKGAAARSKIEALLEGMPPMAHPSHTL